jgi:peptidyl-prolyl cis-trans isomerase SurA
MAASHVLVTYTGAVGALPNITRSRDEARTRAEEAGARILAGEDFSEVAKLYSDDSTGPRGGSLGGFGKDTMVAPFEAALAALQVGEVSGLVETPFGFHVIRRDPVLELHAKHLMVTWAGAERAPTGIGRSKEEARTRIQDVKAHLAAGEPWDEVARRYSDDPLKEFGGDLGWFARGQLAPTLDSVAFDLDIGATSDILETPLGYHILYRVE